MNKPPPSKEIDIYRLRQAINMIFDHMENDLNIKTITIEHDYYAALGLHEKFEVLSRNKGADFLDDLDIGLGHLFDDWEFLEGMLQNDSVCIPMFEHVAPILRYISYKGVKSAEGGFTNTEAV